MTEFHEMVANAQKAADIESAAQEARVAEWEAKLARIGIDTATMLGESGIDTVTIWHRIQTGEEYVPAQSWRDLHGNSHSAAAHMAPVYGYGVGGEGWLLYREFYHDGVYVETGNLCVTSDGQLFHSKPVDMGREPNISGQQVSTDDLLFDRPYSCNNEAAYNHLAAMLASAVAHRLSTGEVASFGKN